MVYGKCCSSPTRVRHTFSHGTTTNITQVVILGSFRGSDGSFVIDVPSPAPLAGFVTYRAADASPLSPRFCHSLLGVAANSLFYLLPLH
jgi:hypothetical protein